MVGKTLMIKDNGLNERKALIKGTKVVETLNELPLKFRVTMLLWIESSGCFGDQGAMSLAMIDPQQIFFDTFL